VCWGGGFLGVYLKRGGGEGVFFIKDTGGGGGGGGEVLPYMAYTGMCRWTGYDFWPLCPKQGI